MNKARREIVLDGGVDNFVLGPLTVRGVTGPRATLNCVLGTNTQHVLLNGAVEIFDAHVKALVEIQLLPSPIVMIQLYAFIADSRIVTDHALSVQRSEVL